MDLLIVIGPQCVSMTIPSCNILHALCKILAPHCIWNAKVYNSVVTISKRNIDILSGYNIDISIFLVRSYYNIDSILHRITIGHVYAMQYPSDTDVTI